MRRPARRIATFAVSGALLVGTLAGCRPAPGTAQQVQNGQRIDTITHEGDRGYEVDATGDEITIAAPATPAMGNTRVSIAAVGRRAGVDQQICATWTGPWDRSAQPGLTLRVRNEHGGARGIMVTGNILYAARQFVNVSVFGDGTNAENFTRFTSFDLSPSMGVVPALEPLPWRFCARVIGDRLDVLVWSVDRHHPEPDWGDPGFGGSVDLPPTTPRSGVAGVYMAHLSPNERTSYVDVETDPVAGTDGTRRWDATVAWSAELARATQVGQRSERTIASTVDDLAGGVLDRGSDAEADEAARSAAGRRRSARDLAADLVGAAATGSAPPQAADRYAAVLLDSPQFRTRSGVAVDDVGGWLRAVARTVLGRSPTAEELEVWRAALGRGASRRSVARSIFRSDESARRRAGDALRATGQGPATAVETDRWAGRWAELGHDDVRLRAAILASVAPRS
jgi:hypothetical protein